MAGFIAVAFTARITLDSLEYLSIIMISSWFPSFVLGSKPSIAITIPSSGPIGGKTVICVKVLSVKDFAPLMDIGRLSCKRHLPYAASKFADTSCRTLVFPCGGLRVSYIVPSALSVCEDKLEQTAVGLHGPVTDELISR